MLAVVHAGHLHAPHVVPPVAHGTHVHAHVDVGEVGHGIHGRHFRLERGIGRQGTAGIPGTVDGLCEDGIGLVVGLDDDVIGLGHADAELVHADRFHVLAVGGHHGHFQAGDAHVEEAHGGTVDEAQPHLLPLAEQSRPAIGRRLSVGQVGVGVAAHVGQVTLAHAHLHPHLALVPGARQPLLLQILHQVLVGTLVEVVVMTQLFELGVDVGGILVGPVGEHHHVVPVVAEGLGLEGVDDDRPIEPGLFLEAGVAVVPVGTALLDGKAVGEGLARRDAVEAVSNVRYPVHGAGQDEPVPVDGGGLGQPVGDPQGDGITLLPAQQGRRQ